ncbi:MAG: hypothetical protein ACT4OZ_16855 [Gemmatimonadota bacterium]
MQQRETEAPPPKARADTLVRIALVCLVAAVAILTITPWPVGAFQDDAIYTVLAKSLAEGHGYKLLNLPGEPDATHFPPGYPLFLALIWKVWPSFPDNIVAFKFANALLLACAALGTFTFAKQKLGSTTAAASAYAIAGTLSIVVLLVTGVIMSEPLFMALLFPALLSAERTAESGSAAGAARTGLWLGALALVRTLGLFTIPAALLVLVLRRHWRAAFALAATASLLVVPWQLWVTANQSEVAPILAGKFGSYSGWLVEGYRDGGLAFVSAVIARNLADIDGMMSYHLLPIQPAFPRGVVFVSALALGFLGIKRFARKTPVTLVFIGFYILVVMLWPFEPNRFLLPLWPLWPMLVVGGIQLLWNVSRPRPIALLLRTTSAIAAATILVGVASYNYMGYSRRWWNSIQRDAGQRARPIVEWTAANTSAADVLATDDDLIVYLYTGRKTIPTSTFTPRERVRPLTDDEDAAAVRDLFAAYQPDYYVVASKRGMLTANTLATGEGALLRPWSRTPNALIYRSVRP